MYICMYAILFLYVSMAIVKGIHLFVYVCSNVYKVSGLYFQKNFEIGTSLANKCF